MKNWLVCITVLVSTLVIGSVANARDLPKVSKSVSVDYSENGTPDVTLSLGMDLPMMKQLPVLKMFDWSASASATMYGSNSDVVSMMDMDYTWEKQYNFGVGISPSMVLIDDISLSGSVGVRFLNSDLNGMDKSISGVTYGVGLSKNIAKNMKLSVGYSETKWDKDDTMDIPNIVDNKTSGWGMSLTYSF